MPGLLWADISVETLFSRDPGYFHGCIITANAGGGRVRFYDGSDATTGRLIMMAKGANQVSNAILFPVPLYCQRGLFVTDFSHLDNCLVLWEPAAES